MTDRVRQRRIDAFTIQFVDALEARDFKRVERLWTLSANDAELEAAMLETAGEMAGIYEAQAQTVVEEAIVEAVEKHMPSADVLRPPTGPLTVAEVAEVICRRPPPSLTADEATANPHLRTSGEVVPIELGMSQLVKWGSRFGELSESYWRAFRQTAIKLRMQRECDDALQMAARASTAKPREEGNESHR